MCKKLEDLKETIRKYSGDLTKDEIVRIVKYYDYTSDSIGMDIEAILGLQEAIRQRNNSPDYRKIPEYISDLMVSKQGTGVSDINNWTIRHYTSLPSEEGQRFSCIKSSLCLKMEGYAGSTTTSGHTNKIDWASWGNMGNTFYLLCYEGEPIGSHEFLKDSTHYVEFPLKDIDRLWISDDWLNPKHLQTDIIYGNGKHVFNKLLLIIGKMRGNMAIGLLAKMYPTLEVKIPHNMEIPATGFQKVTK